jgi:NADPH:quinone reductase-like Zn-dependent oxidoreductase
MMRRTARVKPGQRVLIHAAAGGIGTALLQLGGLIDLEMYGTASAGKHELVSSLGGTPIDYRNVDFMEEIRRLTGDGVDVVFDGICSPDYLRRSFKSLRPGGKVVAYGGTSTLRGGRLASGRRHRRLRRLQYLATIGGPIAASHLAPGNKRITTYSIQWLKRLRPAWYREDLLALFELLRQGKLKPIIAQRIPLDEVARAHELLGSGAVMGKIVLLCDTRYRE